MARDGIKNNYYLRHVDNRARNTDLLWHVFTAKTAFAVAIYSAGTAANNFISVGQYLNAFAYRFGRKRGSLDGFFEAAGILGDQLRLPVTCSNKDNKQQ